MMGLLPVLALVVLALWQVGLLGYTYLLAGHAAREGARELAVNTRDTKKEKPYRDAAEEDLPKAWRKDAKIEIDKDDPVTVNVKLERAGRAARAQQPVQGLRPRLDLGRGRAAPALADEATPTPSREARLADESGQASAELMGMMVWLLLVTLIVWQVCLAAWTYTQVSNAARTASRVEGRGGDAREGGQERALEPAAEDDREDQDRRRDQATVTVRMPLLIPGLLTTDQLTATAHRGAPRPDGPARPHRGRAELAPLQRGRRRRRRLLLPQAPARGGQPLRDRRAVARRSAARGSSAWSGAWSRARAPCSRPPSARG